MNIEDRLRDVDWKQVEEQVEERGYATTPPILTTAECNGLAGLYADAGRFRSRVEMAHHRFGAGEYKYFASPLPPLVEQLRSSLYPPLASIANRWMEIFGTRERYPADLRSYLSRCHDYGQTKPTPLILRYEAGGYNCLHQDLYGELAFPLQAACVLSRQGADYTGGEFLLVEQRPRAQSMGTAITLERGAFVIFPNRYRPVRGSRGHYRVNMRHGVSRVTSGVRLALGIIFHDAK